MTGEPTIRPLAAPSSTTVMDSYQVELTGTPRAGGEGEVSLNVRRDGRPVADLEPYLGPWATSSPSGPRTSPTSTTCIP